MRDSTLCLLIQVNQMDLENKEMKVDINYWQFMWAE